MNYININIVKLKDTTCKLNTKRVSKESKKIYSIFKIIFKAIIISDLVYIRYNYLKSFL